MSTNYPSTPLPSSMKITSVQPTLVSVAHNLKRQVRTRGGQRWSFVLTYSNRSRADMAPIMAFLQAQQGQFYTFQYSPTMIGTAQNGVTSCVVNAPTASGGSVPVTMVGTLKAGDYVKFNAHSKVYMVLEDLTGSGTLKISPNLHTSVASTENVVTTAVPFTVARASDNFDLTVNAPNTFDWTVELVEVV